LKGGYVDVQKAKSGSMMLLKKKKEDMFYSTDFTNAMVWLVSTDKGGGGRS
jgi:hypothetical protein